MPYIPTTNSFISVLHIEIWELQILTMVSSGYQALYQYGLYMSTAAWFLYCSQTLPPVPVPFRFLVLTSGAMCCVAALLSWVRTLLTP